MANSTQDGRDTLPLHLDEMGRGTHIPPMKIDAQVRQHLESVMQPFLVSHCDGVFNMLILYNSYTYVHGLGCLYIVWGGSVCV